MYFFYFFVHFGDFEPILNQKKVYPAKLTCMLEKLREDPCLTSRPRHFILVHNTRKIKSKQTHHIKKEKEEKG